MLQVSVARGEVYHLGWQVSAAKPLLAWDIPQVIAIQADGPELELIHSHFPDLPFQEPCSLFLGKDARVISGKLLC